MLLRCHSEQAVFREYTDIMLQGIVIAGTLALAGTSSAAWNLGQWGGVMFEECSADVASPCSSRQEVGRGHCNNDLKEKGWWSRFLVAAKNAARSE